MKTVYNILLTTLNMAKFKITPTTTVAELKEQFRNEVGCVLRVYQGRSEAPDGATLVSLGAKEGELECRTSRTVGKFEEAFQNELNLKVKVYTKDNWVKVLDGITLAVAGQLPNGMTKAKMEEYLSYKRDEKEEDTETVNEDSNNISTALRNEILDDGDVTVRLHKVEDISNLTDKNVCDRKFVVRMESERGVALEAYQYLNGISELTEKVAKFEKSQRSYYEFCKIEIPKLELYYFNQDAMVGEEILNDYSSDIFVPQSYWEIYQGDSEEEEWPEMDTSLDEHIVNVLNMENEFTMGWIIKFYNEGQLVELKDCI